METRVVFWPSLLLFVVVAVLLASGLKRARREPQSYRGKIAAHSHHHQCPRFCPVWIYHIRSLQGSPAAKNTPQVGQRAPAFSLVDANGKNFSLNQMLATPIADSGGAGRAPKGVLLLFYRGYWWGACTSELRGIQRNLAALEAAGVRAVAISADTNDESRELCRKANLTFPLLSDRKAEVIRSYDLLVPGAGEDSRDISGIAEFLLDSSGTVRWRHFGEKRVERLIEEAKKL
jgi:peroxiredoxin